MKRILTRISMAALAGLVTLASTTDADAQQTFEACRVPNVGAIYMINVTGAPSACLDPTHVQFSWTEGTGGIGAGSVGTTELADNAVTSAKIAGDAITSAKIGLGEVGTDDIADSSISSGKIIDGAVAGVDIAQGAIGTGQLATDAVDANAIATDAVGSDEIVDGSVGALDLAPGSMTHFRVLNIPIQTVSSSITITEFGSITFDAPTSGVVYVTATGYCNLIIGPATPAHMSFGLDLSSGTAPSASLGGAFIARLANLNYSGTEQASYGTSRAFNVNAGSNTVYLNHSNITGTSIGCNSYVMLMFAPSQIT